MINQVIIGMHLTDYEDGFGNHNYGCTIDLYSEKQIHSTLLAWNEIVEGRKKEYKSGKLVIHIEMCYVTL